MTTNFAFGTYLFFNGRCEEAIEFYRKVLNAEPLMVMRYKDAPPGAMPEECKTAAAENKVMHARLRIGNSSLMLSDGPCTGKFDGFALSVAPANASEAEQVFAALSAGGQVNMPLTKTFFSPAFGMLTDPFGVKWMINVESPR